VSGAGNEPLAGLLVAAAVGGLFFLLWWLQGLARRSRSTLLFFVAGAVYLFAIWQSARTSSGPGPNSLLMTLVAFCGGALFETEVLFTALRSLVAKVLKPPAVVHVVRIASAIAALIAATSFAKDGEVGWASAWAIAAVMGWQIFETETQIRTETVQVSVIPRDAHWFEWRLTVLRRLRYSHLSGRVIVYVKPFLSTDIRKDHTEFEFKALPQKVIGVFVPCATQAEVDEARVALGSCRTSAKVNNRDRGLSAGTIKNPVTGEAEPVQEILIREGPLWRRLLQAFDAPKVEVTVDNLVLPRSHGCMSWMAVCAMERLEVKVNPGAGIKVINAIVVAPPSQSEVRTDIVHGAACVTFEEPRVPEGSGVVLVLREAVAGAVNETEEEAVAVAATRDG
jgi:hypothetical protein